MLPTDQNPNPFAENSFPEDADEEEYLETYDEKSSQSTYFEIVMLIGFGGALKFQIPREYGIKDNARALSGVKNEYL